MNINTFRNNITKPSVKLRYKFLVDSVDRTELLIDLPTITRNVNLAAGKATVVVNNAGQWWNSLYATNVSLGGTAEIQVYIDGDASNVLTVLKGKIQRPKFQGAKAALVIRDHSGDWLNRKVGSNRVPSVFYQAQTRFADDFVWSLLTRSTEGNLSSLSSPDNDDIEYASFAAWRNQHTRSEGYRIRARLTGHTISETLMRVCQLTHSYIWVNNNGKVDFAPPFSSGYEYDESNASMRDLEMNEDRILNQVEARFGYNFDSGTWVGIAGANTEQDSIDRYGTFAKTIEDRIVVHMDATSAAADVDATIADYAYPLKFVMLKAGPPAIMEDLANQLTVSDTIRGWSGINPILEEITYDLDKWEVTMKARWPW
ncbi:MAG: hypothetical protein ACXABF_17300 [Candidatus Thorarchaeota archaeon]|jgi:hypothetical protein